jgi:hypothetical protein
MAAYLSATSHVLAIRQARLLPGNAFAHKVNSFLIASLSFVSEFLRPSSNLRATYKFRYPRRNLAKMAWGGDEERRSEEDLEEELDEAVRGLVSDLRT